MTGRKIIAAKHRQAHLVCPHYRRFLNHDQASCARCVERLDAVWRSLPALTGLFRPSTHPAPGSHATTRVSAVKLASHTPSIGASARTAPAAASPAVAVAPRGGR